MASSWELVPAPDGTSRLAVRGDLDVAVGEAFIVDVAKHLDEEGRGASLVLDLGGVDFIDSSGLRALLDVRRTHGDAIRIGSLSRPVRRLLELTATTELFTYEPGADGDA